MPYLTVQRIGSRRIRTVDLEPHAAGLEVGRSSGVDLTLRDRSVSRAHCVFEHVNGRWVVRDLESRHGFKVNHVRMRTAALDDGDLVRVGRYHLTFHLGALAASERDDEDDLEALTLRGGEYEDDETGASLTSIHPEVDQQAMAALEGDLAAARHELAEVRTALERANADCGRQRSAREEAERARDELQREVEELRSRATDEEEMRSAAQSAIAQETETRALLEAELREVAALRDAVREQIREIEARLEAERDAASDLRADLEGVEAERDALKERAADAERGLEEQTRSAEEARQEAAARAEQLESELARIREEIGAREAEEVRGLHDRIAALQQEVQDAHDRAAQLEEETDRLGRERDEAAAALGAREVELEEARRPLDAEQLADAARAEIEELRGRADAAERAAGLAHQNLDQYRDRFKQMASERERLIARLKLVQLQLRNANLAVQQARAESRKREAMLTEYIRQISQDDAVEATVVELTEDEIRRATAAGATIVEVDGA